MNAAVLTKGDGPQLVECTYTVGDWAREPVAGLWMQTEAGTVYRIASVRRVKQRAPIDGISAWRLLLWRFPKGTKVPQRAEVIPLVWNSRKKRSRAK